MSARGRLLPTVEYRACPACGKERPVKLYEGDAPLADKLLSLAEHSLCVACSAEMGQWEDMCPETIIVQGGVSSCQLGWKHAGRCEPFERPRVSPPSSQEGIDE